MSNDAGSGAAGGIPAGWYDDPSGSDGRRWWDGTAWTSHVQQPVAAAPAPVAPQPTVPAQPHVFNPAPSTVLQARKISDGAHDTRSAWWIAFSPLWSVVGQAILFSTILALLSLPFAQLLPELVLTNIVLWALVLVLAFVDRAQLIKGGNVTAASPFWVLLTPLAYLVVRTQHVRMYATGAWTLVIWWCVATVLAPGLAVLGVFAAYGIFAV